MNKPTREQIEHRAIEKLLNFKNCNDDCLFFGLTREECRKDVFCTKAIMEKALEEAEKELTKKLSLEEKQELRLFLSRLQNATMHDYTHIEIRVKPVRHTRFYIAKGDYYDSKSGILFCLQSLKVDKRYSIEDLLNG